MTASATQALITTGLTDYGTAALAILGGMIVLFVGYVAFRFGLKIIKRALR